MVWFDPGLVLVWSWFDSTLILIFSALLDFLKDILLTLNLIDCGFSNWSKYQILYIYDTTLWVKLLQDCKMSFTWKYVYYILHTYMYNVHIWIRSVPYNYVYEKNTKNLFIFYNQRYRIIMIQIYHCSLYAFLGASAVEENIVWRDPSHLFPDMIYVSLVSRTDLQRQELYNWTKTRHKECAIGNNNFQRSILILIFMIYIYKMFMRLISNND